MVLDWPAAGVIIAGGSALCGLFFRLGKLESSKADKTDCKNRAEKVDGCFAEVNEAASVLNTAVARVQENQIAHEKLITRQVDVIDRLETVVNKGIRNGSIRNVKGATE